MSEKIELADMIEEVKKDHANHKFGSINQVILKSELHAMLGLFACLAVYYIYYTICFYSNCVFPLFYFFLIFEK